ncbi:glycoside hydrolase family 27 protein [Trichoderma virens Gv29-8]|uniref:Alpha-galactosidase n=1 Tax=Hypocrea virens (strain Gv29-8 / FGSC 10586) TaxID=413071 RepID=G9NAK7_HYPVG|nr:glycoside hydrolase family 27 protein [Trichoderma virens Gv29-8]EHK15868.1 glycoside hydrolase family 27 protein [Trichoderma virens Gv29-8]
MRFPKEGLLVALSASGVRAVNNGLARTPQMGWNNWNTFHCSVSSTLLTNTAKLLTEYGLQDLGYKYVVLDDCWSSGRDANGKLVADTTKFPDGMGAVADALHEQGFLFGMYSSAGEMTCARYAGSLDYEENDAQSFADWGVDYLKYDNCYHMGRFGTPLISFNRFNEMAKALKKTGRSILYSLCNWGEDYVHTWGGSIANSWRISGDIYDSFARPDDLCSCTNAADPACIAPGTHCSVLAIINKVAPYIDRGLPGGWNDLDMLEVGHGGMTEEEYKAHFSMWAALKSPLLLGNDLRAMTASSLAIINNPAIIALNQDPRGRAIQRISRDLDVPVDRHGVGETHVWSGPLANGDQVVIFLNAADADLDMSASLEDIFIMDGVGTAPQIQQDWAVHDLWGNSGSRMSLHDAQALLDAKDADARRSFLQTKLDWYNATELPYAQGLSRRDPRLFGERIGVVEAGGKISARVPRHAAKVFRLQSVSGQDTTRKSLLRDEL